MSQGLPVSAACFPQAVANVASGSRLPALFDLNGKDKIQKYVGVIRNFLNYLLYHDVCPEYGDQISSARSLCEQAQQELWNVIEAQPLLPGSFNTACSEIFGGIFQGLRDPGCEEWMEERDKQHLNVGMTPEKARKVFKVGLAAYGTDDHIAQCSTLRKDKGVTVVSSKVTNLEITGIRLGSSVPEIVALYKSSEGKDLSILGKLNTRTWQNPEALEEDLSVEEESEMLRHPRPHQDYEFLVEDELLKRLCTGMRLETTVRELNFGFHYFDAVQMLRCSFFTLLPNELIDGWRKIEDEWLLPRSSDGETGYLMDKTDQEDRATDNGNLDGEA